MMFPSACARKLQRLVLSSYDVNPKLGGGSFHDDRGLEMLDFRLAIHHPQPSLHHINLECYLSRFTLEK
jgi:hypothetical protein